ncbi:MAG: TIGR00282 family metallophosphoesterase [Holosporales bacterium]|jgi:metallophosphoesterase (TIGR00282 family)|nr:TIGR00282 family metallophosphoesterase [Holosporales bacterium]
MKILFCGDVVARAGRAVLKKYISSLKTQWNIDCVIANGENAQHGFGLSEKTSGELFSAGVDVITTGNHVWDCRELFSYIEKEPRIVRPINFADSVPGHGFFVHKSQNGSVLVINAMGQVFMNPQLDNAFPIIRQLLKSYQLGANHIKAIVVDFHAEASAEKAALAYYLDGLVSAVIGTHTHVPTADERILPNGTAFITDVGMCGDYASVIGFSTLTIIPRYLKKIPMQDKHGPSTGPATLCGALLETNDESGLCTKISTVRLDGVLNGTENVSIPG